MCLYARMYVCMYVCMYVMLKVYVCLRNVAGITDTRFQAMMPDALHWLGITKIDKVLLTYIHTYIHTVHKVQHTYSTYIQYIIHTVHHTYTT